MESDSRRRSVKVVRVLCDGCERASAVAYCTACNESACSACAEQLHARARKTSKRPSSRTCNGRSMKDLQKSVGVLALCTECRSRPASRYKNGEAYALCEECRRSCKPRAATAAQEVVKRAIADEMKRSSRPKRRPSTTAAETSAA